MKGHIDPTAPLSPNNDADSADYGLNLNSAVLALLASQGLKDSALVVCWDQPEMVNLGLTSGGDFLQFRGGRLISIGKFRPFPLPGGAAVLREPRRSALGLLFEIFGDTIFKWKELATVQAFTAKELKAARLALRDEAGLLRTSSVERLLDGVASLLGLRQLVKVEGQALIDVEFTLDRIETEEAYRLVVRDAAGRIIDAAPMIEQIVADLRSGVPVWEISAKFHNALAYVIVAMARRVQEPVVVLIGSAFHNKHLCARVRYLLEAEGFRSLHPQRSGARELRAGILDQRDLPGGTA